MKEAGSPLVAAVDVGGTTIKAALVDAEGTLTARRRIPVAGIAPAELVPTVIGTVADLLSEVESTCDEAVAVGLAVPGVVDEADGIGRYSMILGWRDVPFAQLLARFGKPVAFGHDVSAGAYGESRRGAALGHSDWLFLALGTGLGSTFVLRDRPYRGHHGTGGELAHVVVRPDGPRCRCGKRGCLEMIATGPAIAAAYTLATGADPGSLTAADVARRAPDGDPQAAAVWGDAVGALSEVVAGYVESMNPSLVVVGGGLAEAGELLMAPLAEAVGGRVAFADPAPRLVRARHGADAALVGVAVAAHELAATGTLFGSPFRSAPPPPPGQQCCPTPIRTIEGA